MRFNRVPVYLLSFFMLSSWLITGGCKRPYSLKSTWLDKEVIIDGKDRDWKGNRRYYDEKSNTRISICNDKDNLYIRLIAMDPAIQMSIQRHGLSMWLSETGKSENVWGLRYPGTAQGEEGKDDFGEFDKPGSPGDPRGNEKDRRNHKTGGAGMDRDGHGRAEGPSDMQGPPDPPSFGDDERGELDIPLNDNFFILGPDEGPGSILTPQEINDFGVFCKVSQNRGSGMVYEIKIPLNQSEKTPYAARLSPEQIVSIGFITEKVAGGNRRQEGGPGGGGMGGGPGGGGMGGGPGGGGMGGGPGGGGMGGGPGGGGMGGGPGGGGMGGGPDMGNREGSMGGGQRVESMEIWANIELASDPLSAQQ